MVNIIWNGAQNWACSALLLKFCKKYCCGVLRSVGKIGGRRTR